MSKSKNQPRPAFAAVQALVAIVFLATFAGIAAAWTQEARKQNAGTVTMANLKECAIAVHNAHDVNKKTPPYSGKYGGKDKGTFHYHLLPYLEQPVPWNAFNGDAVVPPYLSPEDPTRTKDGAGATNFPVNARLFYANGGLGLFGTGDKVLYLRWDAITGGDGLSNTLLFATKYQHCGGTGGSLWLDPGNNEPGSRTAATFGNSMDLWQSAPKQADCDPSKGTAVSFNDKFISVAMCDASVRNVTVGLTPATWRAVHTWRGNDEIGKDWEK